MIETTPEEKAELVGHTPLPWKRRVDGIIRSKYGPVDLSAKENVEFIIEACNMHDEFIELLEEVKGLTANTNTMLGAGIYNRANELLAKAEA